MPGNFLLHLVSGAASKIGDELASARLVLAWLMAALGAPAFLTGLLVPVREAGALLPQLAVAGYIRRVAVRKWFWVAGSVIQGVSVLGMALVALTETGARAGWLIVALLTVFSLARGVSSVAHKDVLGKTIAKARRGTVMGYSAAVAGVVAVAVGAYARFLRDEPGAEGFFIALLSAAGILWLLSAVVFARLREQPGAIEGGASALGEAMRSLGLLRNAQFRRFVMTRSLLLSTALALPFYAVLARTQTGGGIGALGLMIIASGIAGSISAPWWGRMADRSSRRVLMLAAGGAGLLGVITFVLVQADSPFLASDYGFALLFLLIGAIHSGIRLGRKTYLVDMATAETRASYVAVSNTVIGVVMLVGGGFGMVAQAFGAAGAILTLAVVSLVGAWSAASLAEVQ